MVRLKRLSLILILAMALQLSPAAASLPPTSDGSKTALISPGEWYFIELESPALALFARSNPAEAQGMLTSRGKLDVQAPLSQAFISVLKGAQAKFAASLNAAVPSVTIARTFQVALNGMAVKIPGSTPATLQKIMSLPGVERVHPQRIYSIDMNASLPLIKAAELWNALGSRAEAGKGIRVAVVDTGIDPEHPMFAGAGFEYPAGDWPKGYCASEAGVDFCNEKLISARFYEPDFPDYASDEVLTPQDIHGHGSHTAGTSTGNAVVSDFGADTPEISGVAPGAWVMAYKALFMVPGGSASGSNFMLASAVEDALVDGADVINNSWGSSYPITRGQDDLLVQAYEAAVNAGVVVVFSNGNSGSEFYTAGSPGGQSDKFIAAGASTTGRAYSNALQVTAPEPVDEGLRSNPSSQFVDIDPAVMPTGPVGPLPYLPFNREGHPDTTVPGLIDGIENTEDYASGYIALIPRGTYPFTVKLDNAIAHGADAVVMYTDDRPWTGGFTAGDRAIYTVMISNSLGLDLKLWWIRYPRKARLMIGYPVAPFEMDPNVIADFSSRGPSLSMDIKPDVIAPGINILSAMPGGSYQLMQGTSMSAPHVTGAAALLKQLHPEWTPAQVKSALMNTASQSVLHLNLSGPATVMEQGAGLIDLSKAGDPGLTFDDPSHSFGIMPEGAEETIQITATNVSNQPESYSLSYSLYDSMTGEDPGGAVMVTVTPDVLDLPSSASGTFIVNVQIAPDVLPVGTPWITNKEYEGNIVLTGSRHALHIPYWMDVAPKATADVLLVDMDESDSAELGCVAVYGTPFNDYAPVYTTAMDELGVEYDVWNTWERLGPPRAVLGQYDKVIVFTGDYGGDALCPTGPETYEYYFLDYVGTEVYRTYLGNGGKLLVTGKDALGSPWFGYYAGGPLDGLASYMRGAGNHPLVEGVFGLGAPAEPSLGPVGEKNPFLEEIVLDLSPAGDGTDNQFGVYVDPGDGSQFAYGMDEVQAVNTLELNTSPLLKVTDPAVKPVQGGFVASRSSYEPSIERVKDPIGTPQKPVSWRVAFLGFGLEGVNDDTGYTTRSELLAALFSWFDDEVTVALDKPAYVGATGQNMRFNAALTSSEGGGGVTYRWDFGDGSPIGTTTTPYVSHQYTAKGTYNLYVEATDEYGHAAVSAAVQVTIAGHLNFLPWVLGAAD